MNWLTERGYIAALAKVEACLAGAFLDRGLLDRAGYVAICRACEEVTAEEVYAEEEQTRHQVRALVNVIRRRVPRAAAGWVHLGATSSDVTDSANAFRFKETLYTAKHAGVRDVARSLRGKMSGAVGTYAAFGLLVPDPRTFEHDVLIRLGLEPADYSSQIVPPDQWADLAHALVSALPPEWRAVYAPRVVTAYMDQISEHQRDLTGSASARFLPELIDAYLRLA